jgi:outer membrane receptor for ferrienterochelin and colicins
MKKIAISTSAVMLLSTLTCASENMQTLDVVSIATKTEKSIDGVAATVEVITQAEIEQMGAESLKDIIEKSAGLTVQYGTFPNAASKSKSSISIRGMSSNGTLFLLDGRRLAGEVSNPYDLDRIPASIIERIEIVKGPMSSLYGADAVGGVINIITKRPTKEMQVDASARYGVNENSDAQNVNLGLSVQGKNEGFAYSAYANMTTTEPYTQGETADVWAKNPGGAGKIKPSTSANPLISKIQDSYPTDVSYREESTIYTLGSRLAYDFTPDLVLGFDVNYFTEERDGTYIGYFHPANIGTGLPIFNVPVNSKDENERVDLSVDLSYSPTENLALKTRIYNSKYTKRNTTTAEKWSDMSYASEADSAVNGMNADVDLSVAELSATYLANEANLLTVGAEYRDERRNATVFTQSNDMSEAKMDYQSIYFQDELEASEKLNLIIGARYDAISNAENKPTFRLGGIYTFNKLAKFRANFAQGYRTPDIREMYINKQTANGIQIGADVMGYDLKPESTNSVEVGLGGHAEKFKYDFVMYYNQVNDMIDQVTGTYGGNTVYTFENIANARTYGMELSLAYRFTKEFSGDFYWSELRTENEITKQDLEFQPDRTLRVGLNYEPVKYFNLGVIAKYIGAQHYTEVIDRGTPTETTVPNSLTDSYTLVDLNIDYKLSKMFEIYGGINNVTDETVDDVLGSNVGRYYFAGARLHF